MIRTLTYDKLRTYILPLLIGLLAFFAGEGLFKIMAERSLGSILRHNVGTIAILAILFAFCNENFIPAIFDFKKAGLPSIKQAAPLAVLAPGAKLAPLAGALSASILMPSATVKCPLISAS